MKTSIALLGFACLLCTSCSNVKETPKGFPFTVCERGDGVIAQPGQFLIMSMEFRDGKDSVWSKTESGEPMVVMIQDTSSIKYEDGIEEIFRMMSKGDSIRFTVPARTLFEKTFRQPVPPNVDPNSEFKFNMRVHDVTNREQVDKLTQEIQVRQRDRIMKLQAAQLSKDIVALDEYLTTHNVKVEKDSSGLRYSVERAGKGPKPNASDTVMVTYVGKVMDTGKVFDQSSGPVTFPLMGLIRGWQIGFPLLQEGSKATLYIPSTLGYGPGGSPPQIPGNANLIFEVELIKINPKRK